MPSDKFVKTAKKVAQRDAQVFEALMDFEQSKSIRTKQRMDFTIDTSITSRFRRLCRQRGWNMSAKVEQALRDLVEKEEKEKN